MIGKHCIKFTMRKDKDNPRMALAQRIVRSVFFRSAGRRHSIYWIAGVIFILSIMVGCGPSTEDLQAVKYTPLPRDDWKVSTPAEQGLDPMLVAELYYNAAELETVYGLLVVKNGYLIAERYFNKGSVDQKARLQSVTKSFTSALAGIALDKGFLSSVDQKMIDFFPEIADQITDPRKKQITIRHLLQMRAGYPWEESHPDLWKGLLSGYYLPAYRGISSRQRAGNQVPLQQSDVQLAGDYRGTGLQYRSQVFRPETPFLANWRGGGGLG